MKRFFIIFLLLCAASILLVACGGEKNSTVSPGAHVWNFEVATQDVAVFDPATRTTAVCRLNPKDLLPVIADDNGVWTIQSSVFTTDYRVQCPGGRPAWVRASQGELVPIK